MVRFLKENEKGQCRPLWESAFSEDSPAFVDYYFAEKTKDNRILVREEDGIIQSMLHLNPYRLWVKGRIWQADYIVGVATRTDCRRRGYMRALLDEMFGDLWNREMPFVYLMPAAKEIYEPFDFVYIYDQPVWHIKEGFKPEHLPLLAGGRIADQKQWDAMSAWMNQWLKRRYQVYAIRDQGYQKRLGKELASEQGQLELLCEQDAIIGAYAEWGTKAREQRFLYTDDTYVDLVEEKPAIMARIVNLNACLEVICLNSSYIKGELQIRLQLTDKWIPENHGLWIWTLTKEKSWVEAADEVQLRAAELGRGSENGSSLGDLPVNEPAVLELTIGELTSWLFGYSVPEAAKPYEHAVAVLQDVFLDEVV